VFAAKNLLQTAADLLQSRHPSSIRTSYQTNVAILVSLCARLAIDESHHSRSIEARSRRVVASANKESIA
jgi:hypothetical protein